MFVTTPDRLAASIERPPAALQPRRKRGRQRRARNRKGPACPRSKRWNQRPTFLFHVRLRPSMGAAPSCAPAATADAGGKASLFESSGRGAAARGLRLSFEDDRDRRRKADT